MIRVPKSRFHQKGNFAVFPAGTIAEIETGGPGFSGGPYLVFDHRNFPLDAQAGCQILPSGEVRGIKSTGSIGQIGRWDGGSGTLTKTDYQFRYDITAGQTPNGLSNIVDAWLAPSIFNQWEQIETGFGVRSSSGDLRMRLAVAPFTEFTSTTLFLEADTT